MTWDGTNLTVQGTLKLPDGSSPVDQDDIDDATNGVRSDIQNGFIGGLTISNTKVYFGAGNYANDNTAFFVGKQNPTDTQAKFSLGDNLTWDGSTLSITGTVVITSGATKDAIDNAQNTANTANTTATTAQTTANNALPSSTFNRSEIVSRINSGYGGGSTTINGGTITTGTISASAVVADFISAFSIDADQINAGTITGVNIASGSFSSAGSGRINLSASNAINLIGSESGGTATQLSIFSGGSQGLRIETSSYGDTWINGQTWYINLTEFMSSRYITGLRADFATGTTLVYANNGYIYRSSSKRELKENITSFTNVNLIDQLKPRTFTWKKFKRAGEEIEETEEERLERESSTHIGFIAEEVEEIENGLLSIYGKNEDGVREVEMYKHLDILALCVANIQDLRKRVAELESNR